MNRLTELVIDTLAATATYLTTSDLRLAETLRQLYSVTALQGKFT